MFIEVKNSQIFTFIAVVLVSSFSLSDVERKLTLTKGSEYEICGDMFSYISQMEENTVIGGVFDGVVFPLDGEKISSPVFNEENPYLGFKLIMQDASLGNLEVKAWEKYISDLEEIMDEGIKVKVGHVDLNNDGNDEHVASVSLLYEKVGFVIIKNFVIDEHDNLDFEFLENGKWPSIGGQLFQYDGRTFSISRFPSGYSINEFFDSPMREKGGVHLRYEVCKIEF